MKNILVRFYAPQELFPDEVIEGGISDKQIIDTCFLIGKFKSEESALYAYAETPCTWSRLMNEEDDIQAFIKEAWQHIKNNDIDWLEENFT